MIEKMCAKALQRGGTGDGGGGSGGSGGSGSGGSGGAGGTTAGAGTGSGSTTTTKAALGYDPSDQFTDSVILKVLFAANLLVALAFTIMYYNKDASKLQSQLPVVTERGNRWNNRRSSHARAKKMSHAREIENLDQGVSDLVVG